MSRISAAKRNRRGPSSVDRAHERSRADARGVRSNKAIARRRASSATRTSFPRRAHAHGFRNLIHVRHIGRIDQFILRRRDVRSHATRQSSHRARSPDRARPIPPFASRASRSRGRDRSSSPRSPVARTGTFFCVTTHTESFPRTPMVVTPTDLIALNAYSARRTSSNRGQSDAIVSLKNIARGGRDTAPTASSRARAHAPTWYRRPSGENTVMCRSYPAPAPRDIGRDGLTAARCDASSPKRARVEIRRPRRRGRVERAERCMSRRTCVACRGLLMYSGRGAGRAKRRRRRAARARASTVETRTRGSRLRALAQMSDREFDAVGRDANHVAGRRRAQDRRTYLARHAEGGNRIDERGDPKRELGRSITPRDRPDLR